MYAKPSESYEVLVRVNCLVRRMLGTWKDAWGKILSIVIVFLNIIYIYVYI